MTLRSCIHLGLHLLVPIAIAWFFYRERAVKAFLVMMATMLVDVDHLLATPIYDPNRCSIGFHPLHSGVAIAVYFGLLFPKRTRWVGIGLVTHMILDGIDCAWSAHEGLRASFTGIVAAFTGS